MKSKEDTGIMLIKKLSRDYANEEVDDQNAKSIGDQVVSDFIDKLWNEYDTNRSGYLEEQQAKKLLMDILLECMGDDAEEATIGEEELDQLFKECDIDKSGNISKSEFRALLNEATGI